MRFGVLIDHGPQDWQIAAQSQGRADLRLDGRFLTYPSAWEHGEPIAVPMIRTVRERDNSACMPWRACCFTYTKARCEGTWTAEITLPAGGLYRIETMLSVQWERADTPRKPCRGDVRFHIGVGDLFVIAGQSNAVGRAQDTAEDAPDLMVHVLRNNGRWALAAHPLNESTDLDDPDMEVAMGGTSPYLSFARHFSALAGYPVGLIPAARSGSAIRLWDVTQDGSLYRRMLDRVSAAGGSVRGALWYQGCNDAIRVDLARVYGACLRRMIDRLRADLGAELPFFLFQINRDTADTCDEGWGTVREAQRRIARDTPAVWALPTHWCPLYDNTHNNALSNAALGEHLARQAAGALLGAPAYGAPDLAAAAVSGSRAVRLAFDGLGGDLAPLHQPARLCGFRVEDSRGENGIINISACDGGLLLQTERELTGDVRVSFCGDANPNGYPPKDPVTGLPPMAFYRVPAADKEGIE